MSPPLLAQHALLDGVVLAVVGVAVVFAALVLIWGAIELITRMLTPAAHPDQDTVAGPAPSGLQAMPDGVDGETLAVLSATVFAALGPGARIRRIERIERSPASIWAAHGRVAVQSSHRFRR
jgi:Na+-transporting methylmalonyl-CoA/oxaloacetate decarboxylase gamma subunit